MKTKLTRMTSILLAMLFLIAMFPLQAFALDNGGQGGNDAGELQWICVSGIHSWNAGEVTTAPTCEGVGVRTFTCTLCGKTKTENISALGHAYNDGVVTTEPTCEETGVKTYTCQNDSTHSYTETIPALGHTYGEWTVTKEPTCAEAGSRSRVCSTCEHVDVEEIATLEHTLIPTAAVAATCTTAGNSAYWTCSVCGKYFSDEDGENEIAANSWVIAATGHEWGDWEETTPATCTAAGEETRVCANDENHTETRPIAKLAHTLVPTAAVAATCTADGNSAYWTCSACGKYFSDANGENEIAANSWVIAATGHTWVAWQDGDDIADFELKAEATTESAAVYYKNCSIDGTSAKGIDEDATFTYGEPLPEESDIVYGDADGDGAFTAADVVLMNQYFAGMVTLDDLADGADADGDGEVTAADVVLMNQYFAGMATLDDFGPQE